MQNLIAMFSDAQIAMPAYEVMLLLLALTICLLLRAIKVGLLAAYIFSYRWGWLILERQPGPEMLNYRYGYTILGLVVLGLAFFQMWHTEE